MSSINLNLDTKAQSSPVAKASNVKSVSHTSLCQENHKEMFKNHVFPSSILHPVSCPGWDQLVITLLYRSKKSDRSNSCNTSDPDSIVIVRNTSPPSLSPTNTTSDSQFNSSTKSHPSSYGYIPSDCLIQFTTIISSIIAPEDPSNLITAYRYLDDPIQPLAIEIVLSLNPAIKFPNISNLHRHNLLCQFTSDWNVDVTFQRESVFRRYPRLVCFDMDSTLIEEELIDVIAESIGVEAAVSAITMQAMNGELDFSESLKARCNLLKGVKEDIFVKLRNVVTPTRGLKELIKALKRMGVCTAVFSGGFLPFVSWFSKEFEIDYAFANSLSITDGFLTGELEGCIVDAERKKALLYEIAAKERIGLNQVVAVGDGANDLLMLGAAGLGVAWNAKPLVQEHAQARLSSESLLDLLYFFGLNSEDLNSLIS